MKANKNKGFNLVSVIIIIIVVSIVSGITTGIIVTNTYRGVNTLNDEALSEFLNIYSDITNNYYEDIDKEQMIDKAVDAMLDYLGDSYTTYLTPEEREALEDRLNGTYRGIGVSFLEREVIKVLPDTPAETAGLLKGDIFIRIGDQAVTEYSDDQIKNLIKNTETDAVNITVLRGEEELTFQVSLKNLNNYVIDSGILPDTTIGYVDVPIFAKTVGKQVSDALTEMESEGMDRLIIDLRDDSGGYLDEANILAKVFLENGKLIYSLEDKESDQKYYDDTDAHKTYPIVVLINNNSASASEILAAALKDSYGAVIVGTKSYGKGKVQQTINLNDGSMAKYTSAKWYRPDGTCVDGVGITPDYTIELDYVYDENGNKISAIDTQFDKAVEIIGTL